MQYKPKTPGFRILVKKTQLTDVDPAFAAAHRMGLELTEQTQRQESSIIDTGTVVQVGVSAYKAYDDDPWVKVGDLISYARHAGKELVNPSNKEEKWLCINDEDVVMVWEPTNE
jgi:co-chaperonin GroES (HSP10)